MNTHRQTTRLALGLVTIVVAFVLLSPYPDLAQSKSNGAMSFVRGKVENVGSGKDNGQIQLRGQIGGAGPLDLGAATLHFINFLHESEGTGELVRYSVGSLPSLQLTAGRGSKATEAIFETPPGVS